MSPVASRPCRELTAQLDDVRGRFDDWWDRRSDEERAALIEHRAEELSADCRPMIMAANEHPLERNKPPIFVIVADNRNGRFRVPPMLERCIWNSKRANGPRVDTRLIQTTVQHSGTRNQGKCLSEP